MHEKFTLKTLPKTGGKIQGYLWKVQDARAVMCIVHGIGEHAGRYERMAGYLNEAGIAAVALDLRGHGLSPGKRGHCAPRAEVLKDLDDLIKSAKKMCPGIPLVLYGHSMGGNIVLDYRVRGELNDVPDAYIISAPWIRLASMPPKIMYYIVKAISKIAPEKAINSDIDESVLGNPLVMGDYSSHELIHSKISALCAVEGFDIGEALEKGDLAGNGRGKSKPTLLMHGDTDLVCSVTGSRNLAALKDDKFTYVEWPNLYHEIHNGGEKSDGTEVIKKIISFIEELQVSHKPYDCQ